MAKPCAGGKKTNETKENEIRCRRWEEQNKVKEKKNETANVVLSGMLGLPVDG